jgi:hypothetical protein
MKPFTTLVACLGTVALLLAALCLADWACSSWQTPQMRRLSLADLLHETQRRERLEDDRAILMPIVAEREKIVRDLIEGRRSLRDAAAALRHESESKPPHLRESALRPQGQSIEEYFVRLAFLRAENELKDDSRRDAVLTRLRSELQDFLSEQATAQP